MTVIRVHTGQYQRQCYPNPRAWRTLRHLEWCGYDLGQLSGRKRSGDGECDLVITWGGRESKWDREWLNDHPAVVVIPPRRHGDIEWVLGQIESLGFNPYSHGPDRWVSDSLKPDQNVPHEAEQNHRTMKATIDAIAKGEKELPLDPEELVEHYEEHMYLTTEDITAYVNAMVEARKTYMDRITRDYLNDLETKVDTGEATDDDINYLTYARTQFPKERVAA